MPRARSRPKSRGITSAPRAELSVKASSGFRSGGHAMMRNVCEARNVSISSREAGESSKSCTTSGRSRTMNASDCPISVSWISGSSSASATRQSIADQLSELLADLRQDAHRRPPSVLECDLALQASLLHDADEDVLERESRFARAEHVDAHQRPAPPRSRGGPASTSPSTMTCRRSPNSDTRQRSIVCFSRSAARCGSSTCSSSR